MEWAALLIPIIAGLFCHYKVPHKFVWWEILMPMLPVFIIVPSVKYLADCVMTRDLERHTGMAVRARYYEDWNEYVHKMCTRTVGSGKNARTEIYDCSYVAYHGPEWEVEDSNGNVVSISEADYRRLVSRFGNELFHDLHRHYYTDDGDMYFTDWDQSDSKLQPVTTLHAYENRVQAASGVLAFPEVDDPAAKGLYEYPLSNGPLDDDAILGSAPDRDMANRTLMMWNAKIGRQKEVRIWILLFHAKPRSAGFDQESYWKGGNKNEVVVCIGTDGSGKASWCHPFCWSPDGNTSNDTMKVEIRDFVEKQHALSLPTVVDNVVQQVKEKFQRKQFAEFSYVHVEVGGGWVALIYVLTVLSTIAGCYAGIELDVTQCRSRHKWSHFGSR